MSTSLLFFFSFLPSKLPYSILRLLNYSLPKSLTNIITNFLLTSYIYSDISSALTVVTLFFDNMILSQLQKARRLSASATNCAKQLKCLVSLQFYSMQTRVGVYRHDNSDYLDIFHDWFTVWNVLVDRHLHTYVASVRCVNLNACSSTNTKRCDDEEQHFEALLQKIERNLWVGS